MTKKPNTPLFSTASLLELSMSIGRHRDFEKNATYFTDSLKKILQLTSTEIWFREDTNPRIFSKY